MALSHIEHYKLLQLKVNSLDFELREAMKCEANTDKEIVAAETKMRENFAEYEQKKADLVKEYGEKIDLFSKQVKYHEDVLAKKIEERQSQLAYLAELNVCEKSHQDLVGFDWLTMRKIAAKGGLDEVHGRQYQKTLETATIARSVQCKVDKLYVLLDSTRITRARVSDRMLEIEKVVKGCKDEISKQQAAMGVHESENYRLSLIIRQCISNNEPMSENISRNVRDKCHSFINSNNDSELVQGLEKYHRRQANRIKLLRLKAKKLSYDLSHLQVTSDQTADLIQHYLTMIHASNSRLLAYNPPRNCAPQVG